MTAMIFLVLVSGASAYNTDFSDQAWTSKPIAKVIGLLQDMSKQLEVEQKQDTDMYEEMGCWCKSNDREKTQAIKDANKKIPECEASIEKYTALSNQLDVELARLNKDIAKHTSGLEQATALRAKEHGEFSGDEKDMTATISSLGGAVESLGKSQGSAFLQVPHQIRKTIEDHMQKNAKMLQRILTPKQRSDMKSFIQLGKPGPAASGAIFGTLKQMKETFEGNLVDAQKEEQEGAGQFAALKSARTAELKAMNKQVRDKTAQLADTNQKNAETKTDLEDTQNQLAADTKFLSNVKAMCATADADYAARFKVRGDEITAVGEAITILTADESKDAYGASGHLGFIQISTHHHRSNGMHQRQAEAARILKKAGSKTHNAQILKLAVAAQGPADAMKMVQGQMDALIEELKKTDKEEVVKKDYCDSEIHTNEMETKAKEDQKADTEQLIQDLSTSVDTLNDEINALKASVNQMQVELKRASVDRIQESGEFQQTVNEQRATQTILQKALDRLNAFYAKRASALVQQNHKATGKQTPPAQGTYNKSSGAGGALAMLDHIIAESKDVEEKAKKAENEAEAAYSTFVADSNAAITASQESIMSKTGQVAKQSKGAIEAKADLASNIDDLMSLGEASVALHQDCDFLLKHFTERQESRASEIEGIQAAKAVLGGAKMFLQK